MASTSAVDVPGGSGSSDPSAEWIGAAHTALAGLVVFLEDPAWVKTQVSRLVGIVAVNDAANANPGLGEAPVAGPATANDPFPFFFVDAAAEGCSAEDAALDVAPLVVAVAEDHAATERFSAAGQAPASAAPGCFLAADAAYNTAAAGSNARTQGR